MEPHETMLTDGEYALLIYLINVISIRGLVDTCLVPTAKNTSAPTERGMGEISLCSKCCTLFLRGAVVILFLSDAGTADVRKSYVSGRV